MGVSYWVYHTTKSHRLGPRADLQILEEKEITSPPGLAVRAIFPAQGGYSKPSKLGITPFTVGKKYLGLSWFVQKVEKLRSQCHFNMET